ncbi:MAG: hypothetical protein OEY79_04385, partial [Anaplasmataceae bacterium]|nr:hypothetical protein [Anaplasmataceae bacterium]
MKNNNKNIDGKLRNLISRGSNDGFVTYDDVNDTLSDDIEEDAVDDVIDVFNNANIKILDRNDDNEVESALNADKVENEDSEEAEESDFFSSLLGKTDDPVRLYIREMNSVSLLTRSEEIEIAKQIEEHKKEFISLLCSIPSTLRGIIGWRDEILSGKSTVKDIFIFDSNVNKFDSGKDDGHDDEHEEEGDNEGGETINDKKNLVKSKIIGANKNITEKSIKMLNENIELIN